MLLIYIVCDVKAGLVTTTLKMVVYLAASLVMSLVVYTELQIRGGFKDNSKIIFLISQ